MGRHSQVVASKLNARKLWCRALLTQEGICLTLSPEFHFLEVAYPYVARRLLTAEDPILRERLFQVSLAQKYQFAADAVIAAVTGASMPAWQLLLLLLSFSLLMSCSTWFFATVIVGEVICSYGLDHVLDPFEGCCDHCVKPCSLLGIPDLLISPR